MVVLSARLPKLVFRYTVNHPGERGLNVKPSPPSSKDDAWFISHNFGTLGLILKTLQLALERSVTEGEIANAGIAIDPSINAPAEIPIKIFLKFIFFTPFAIE